MTFVSRRTRIIVSRWLDECDGEYNLRVCRKRSDGRLKRYTSCDDLRAWVNDNCIKHEYLVDLMSDGECGGNNSLCMYGRYVPVPVLLKFFRNLKESKKNEINKKSYGESKVDDFGVEKHEIQEKPNYASKPNDSVTEKRETEEKSKRKSKQDDSEVEKHKIKEKLTVKSEPDDFGAVKHEIKEEPTVKSEPEVSEMGKHETKEKPKSKITQVDFEIVKHDLDQKGKVEKIKKESRDIGTECECQDEPNKDDKESLWIVQCEKYLLEKRFFECRSLLNKAVVKLERIDCIVCCGNEEMENFRNEEIDAAFQHAKSTCTCSTSNVTSILNVKKEKEVTKCREVLRKISKLRQKLKVNRDQQREVNEQIRLQGSPKCPSRVQVTELFSQRNETELKQLQKKLEKLIAGKGKLLSELIEAVSNLNKLKKSIVKSRSHLSFNSKSSCGNEEEFPCGVPVTCYCGCQCTDLFESSNSPLSGDVSQDECFDSLRPSTNSCCYCRDESDRNSSKKFDEYVNVDAVSDKNYKRAGRQSIQKPAKFTDFMNRENYSTTSDTLTWKSYPEQRIPTNESEGESLKGVKKSKLRFVFPEDPCKRKSWMEFFDDGSNDNGLKWQGGVKSNGNVARTRPSTSNPTGRGESKSRIPERKVKSETAMEEIEKALRNYDQRLRNLDCIEYEVEKMKEKMVEDNREKRELQREKEESKDILADEREKSTREMNQLFLENRSLKKQIQQLIANSDMQMKKIEYHQMFEKELECEANELNNRLTYCQDNCENQRKRIAMLEGYIVNQETEIRKLTNIINNPKVRTTKGFQDSTVQRSRSYSPELKKNKRMTRRPMTQGCRFSTSSDEDVVWGCDEVYQQNTRNQGRVSGRGCRTSQPVRRRV